MERLLLVVLVCCSSWMSWVRCTSSVVSQLLFAFATLQLWGLHGLRRLILVGMGHASRSFWPLLWVGVCAVHFGGLPWEVGRC